MTTRPVETYEPDGAGAFLFGLVLGGLIGAFAGLWNAPQSGEALRDRVLRRGDALRDKAGGLVAGERIEQSIAEGKALAQQHRDELAQNE